MSLNFTATEMVLFDLDGTLVNSLPDLAYCVDEMMRQLGLPPPGLEPVGCWVGNGVERLVKRALTGDFSAEPAAPLFARALPLFLELYGVNHSRNSRLYPEAKATLAWLQARKIPLGCVTNKAARFTLPLLTSLEIDHLFALVLCGDSLPEKKPHPLPLLTAAEHFRVKPANCLMVGDSLNDIQAARAAGFPVVAVSYGYNHGLDIRQAGPDAVIDNLRELPALLV
ncbi:MAG: phosphoglycolate phosphatase [Desulfobulbaceae bacterium]|nr:phosphoglycolate phosphatase [Desulfobulbaceae bacterium]